MKFKHKIIFSNAIMLFIPLLFVLIFIFLYFHIFSQKQKENKMSRVLALYENEKENVDWEKIASLPKMDDDYILDEVSLLLKEFFESGFSFSIECDGSLIFSNLRENEHFLGNQFANSQFANNQFSQIKSSIISFNDGLILIEDFMNKSGKNYKIRVLYEESLSSFDTNETLFSFRKNQSLFLISFILSLFLLVIFLNLFLANYINRAADLEHQMQSLSEMARIEKTEIVANVGGEKIVPDSLSAVQPKKIGQETITVKNLQIFPEAHRVFLNGKEVLLKNKEFELLLFLARNPGIVFSKETLFDRVWGDDAMSETSTITVHINRLREKIEKDSSQMEYIFTVWGAGYKFVSEEI